jgi:hypothetical protein
MLSSIRHRRRRPRRRDLSPGRYLTDGRRLLWVLGRFEIPGSTLVSVEDCSTFERYVYAEIELERLRFRRVRTPAQPLLPASGGPGPVDAAAPDLPPEGRPSAAHTAPTAGRRDR